MRRVTIGSILIWTVTVAVLAAAPTAWAGQADQVVITAPWLTQPIKVVPVDEQSSAELDLLREGSGINIAMVPELPGRFTDTRPSGDLGARYRMTWNVPGSGTVIQDVYPYAAGRPVVYTAPQQLVVRHGWFMAPAALGDILRSLGLPESAAPAGPATSDPASAVQQSRRNVAPIALAAAAVLALVAAGWVIRSRRPAVRNGEVQHTEDNAGGGRA
jgi:hypothetical protein